LLSVVGVGEGEAGGDAVVFGSCGRLFGAEDDEPHATRLSAAIVAAAS
jgi:hypothetical protein